MSGSNTSISKRGHQNNKGEREIKIALSHIPYVYFIYHIKKDFEKAYKAKIKTIKAGSSTSLNLLKDNKVDVAMISRLPHDFDGGYDKMLIGRDTLRLAVPNSLKLSKRKEVSVEDIATTLRDESVKFILREEGSGTKEQTLAIFKEYIELILRETEMVLDSNEEILAAVSRSDKYPVKLTSLVSSAMCEHIKPAFASLVDLKADTTRKYFAIKKKSDRRKENNEVVETFWTFLESKLDPKTNFEKIVKELNESLEKVLSYKFMHDKTCVVHYHLKNNEVHFRIYLAHPHGIHTVEDCKMEELQKFVRLGRLRRCFWNSALISSDFVKLRKKSKDELMQYVFIVDEIISEIVTAEKLSNYFWRAIIFILGMIFYFIINKLIS